MKAPQEAAEPGPRTSPVASRGPALTLGTLVAACFAVALAQIGVAIPATLNGLFQQDLRPIGSQLTWISDAFLLPVAALELSFGVLGDLFGRKRLLLAGAVLLAVGEFVGAASSGVYQLWVGQAVAGLGAAALFPTSLAMLAAATHTPRQRARAIALWAGFLSAGGFLAPVLGGVTGNYGSWRWSLVVVGILGAVSVGLSLVLAGDSKAPEGRSLDWVGQATLAVGLIALLYAVIQGPTDGWSAPAVVAGFVVAAVFLALFVLAEARAASPLLRLDLFRNRGFAMASVVAVIGMFSFLGTAYATSIRLGPIQHQSPLRTSVPFLLLQGPAFVLIPLTSRLLERVNPRWLLGSGLVVMAGGQFLAARMPIADSTLTSLVVPIGLVGVGFALAVASITATAVNTVPIHYAGMASATTSLLRDFGFTLGPAVIGAVALGRAAARFGAALPAAGLPAGQEGAARAVSQAGGPLAVNGIEPGQPGSAAHQIAFDALGHGYALGYVVCGVAALAAAVVTIAALRGGRSDNTVRPEALAEDVGLPA
ncbi:MFS transporter [Catenulispora pinisilvae]|uniref:MFS transporter n=1 Tax=Catenulispora pinisilvae TaxID=2705253 RepID=UPI0018910AC1|nr:MFS transporter [Catenulispora pinisilvae]